MASKEWFPPDPLPRKQKISFKIIIHLFENVLMSENVLTFFSEGVWGNRSLDAKERFPQKYLNQRRKQETSIFIHGFTLFSFFDYAIMEERDKPKTAQILKEDIP